MKLKLAFLLFLFKTACFYGQADSSSIKKVDALVEDYYNVTYNNPDSALTILDSAEALAKKIKYAKGITSVMRQRGSFYSERSDFVKSMTLLFDALKKDEQIGNDDGIGMDLLYIGLNYFQQEKLNEALVYILKAQKKYTDIHDEAGVALINANLGMVYRNLDKFDLALKYYFSVRDFYIKQHGERNLEHVENNIGNIYKDLKDYDKALEHFFVARDIVIKSNDTYFLANTLSNIADVYVEKKQFAKAIEQYEEALKIAKEQKALSREKDVHFDLAYAYEMQGDYKKAFENYKEYSSLKDSTISEKYNNDLADMKVKYDSQKKENENTVLKKDNELQETKIRQERNQKLVYAFLLGIVFIAGALVFVQYRNKQKLNKELALVNEKVNNQNTTLRTLNKELIQSEENLTQANSTKDQLISMLSHDLYNPVTSVINYTGGILEQSEGMSKEDFSLSFAKVNAAVIPLQDLLDNILQWARVQKQKIIPNREEVNVAKVISDVVELYQPAAAFKKTKIINEAKENIIAVTDRLMLYFIVRNVLNNAVKFCSADSEILVSAISATDEIQISITNEGRGFTPQILERLKNPGSENEVISDQGSGIGLSVSRQFIKLLDGKIEFKNKDDKGAEVIISLRKS